MRAAAFVIPAKAGIHCSADFAGPVGGAADPGFRLAFAGVTVEAA